MAPGLFNIAACRARLTQFSHRIGWVGHCLRQLDHVAAQRVRRTHQWIVFNKRLWPGGRLTSLLQQLFLKFIQFSPFKTSRLLLSASAAVGLTAEQLEEDESPAVCSDGFTIPDELMLRHVDDVDYIAHLRDTTLTCNSCNKRHVIDGKVEGINYCNCDKKVTSVYGSAAQDVAWTPFLERKDILVWRQEHPDHNGHFAYKMYGRFDDVTALEFLEVQMDVSAFRLLWDKSTAQCYVIEEARKKKEDKNVTQIYYWEVNWPRFFSNRDYVCGRRAKIFDEDKLIVIYSKSTEHSSCPRKCKNFRVDDYFSVLTIKPFKEFDQLGIEFSLTAFENPGLSLPSSIITWVAIRAMPDFMANLRRACIDLRKWKSSGVDKSKQSASVGSSKEPSFMETPHQYRHQSQASAVYA